MDISKRVWILATISITSLLGFVSADWTDSMGSFGYIPHYIFGQPTDAGPNDISNMIITVAIWLLIVITFGDIISTFSSFSKGVSWSVAVLVAIIASNMGIMTGIIALLTSIFAFAGLAAVYVALLAAFVVFIAINLGLWRLNKWIIQRRMMMKAATAEAGGTTIAGAIAGLGKIEKALEEQGK